MKRVVKENRLTPPQLHEVRFGGSVGELFDRVIAERVTSDRARNVVFKEAEDAFLNCMDDAKAPVGIWQGEFWGKLMISACRVCRYTGDAELRGFIRDSVHRMMGLQRADGYIGTYKNPRLVFRAHPDAGTAAMGWACDWNWNIWCRKYTLWGMLEAYALLEERAVLESAARTADQLIGMLEEMGARLCETGTFFGVASGSILKPMLLLYQYTGNKKYLDFSLSIAQQWEDDETCCAKLIQKTLDGTPPHLWNMELVNMQPKSRDAEGKPAFDPTVTFPEISGKVYETLSCFDGLLELYRVTGTELYLHTAKRYFELLVKYEYNTLFSVGFNDVFLHAASAQNSITELCDVIHFIRLATELYKLTGAPRYMDFVELAFYNAFLAGVTQDGTWGARGVRAAERHFYALEQAGMRHNHCCVNNMPRGFINAAEVIALYDADAVYVNLYDEAAVTLRPADGACVKIRIGAGYLQYCETDVHIEAELSGTKTLRLRIPQWSTKTEVLSGGNRFYPAPGSYFDLEISGGITDVHLKFDSTPRLKEYRHKVEVYPMTPYLKNRYISGDAALHEDTVAAEPKATLCVGPVLLAMTRGLGSTKEELFDHPTVCGKGCTCTVVPKPADGYRCGYEVAFAGGGAQFTVPMCDFASAGNSMDLDAYWYTIFI